VVLWIVGQRVNVPPASLEGVGRMPGDAMVTATAPPVTMIFMVSIVRSATSIRHDCKHSSNQYRT
jgi:hypothetical protein